MSDQKYLLAVLTPPFLGQDFKPFIDGEFVVIPLKSIQIKLLIVPGDDSNIGTLKFWVQAKTAYVPVEIPLPASPNGIFSNCVRWIVERIMMEQFEIKIEKFFSQLLNAAFEGKEDRIEPKNHARPKKTKEAQIGDYIIFSKSRSKYILTEKPYRIFNIDKDFANHYAKWGQAFLHFYDEQGKEQLFLEHKKGYDFRIADGATINKTTPPPPPTGGGGIT